MEIRGATADEIVATVEKGEQFPAKHTYDPDANAAYIRLHEKQGDVETIEVTGDFLVDIDETGAVCGIELLNANEQLKGPDGGRLIFVNPRSGEESELKVA